MSKARSLANRSNDFVSVMDFNTASTPVDPTGATDSTAALAAVKTFCSSSSTPVRVIFPAGTYKYSTSPNWAINNLELVAEGLVLFQYTGTGDAFICDANVFGSGGGITGMKVGRFIIQAPSTAGCGALIRSIHHSYFELTVKGCGVGTWGTAIGINVLGCVCTEFYKPTVNIYDVYNGWYLSAAPSVGMYFGSSTYYGASASNIVKNPIIENFTGIGIHIVTGNCNQFFGGTCESITGTGFQIEYGCNGNVLYGMDFEVNTVSDVQLFSYSTYIIGCQLTGFGETSGNITFQTGAQRNVVSGCTLNQVVFNSGSSYNMIDDCTVNQQNTATWLTDNTSGANYIGKTIDIYNGYIGPAATQLSFNWTSSTITIQNSRKQPIIIYISTYVTSLTLKTPSGVFVTCPVGPQAILYPNCAAIMNFSVGTGTLYGHAIQ